MRGSIRGRALDNLTMPTTSPTSEPLPADLFWESAVAQKFGVSRTAVRALRKRVLSAADWRYHNNTVALTASGLAKLQAALAGGSVPGSAAPRPATGTRGPSVPAVPPGPPPRRHFVVTKVPVHRVDAPQKKIVVGRPVPADFAPCSPWELTKRSAHLGDAPELRERPIRVRDNSNFRPGMVFECASIGEGMWQFLGRLPRKAGKW